MLTGTRLELLRSNRHVRHTPREISPASPHNYPIRGYEGVCELMLIPDNVCAKKNALLGATSHLEEHLRIWPLC